MLKNHDKERKVLAQLYANQADSIKFLPFFFQDMKELRRFFNQFGGKTLVLPDTLEEFMQFCLYDINSPKDNTKIGIDENIHKRTKERIIETYLNLYKTLEDVILNELKADIKYK